MMNSLPIKKRDSGAPMIKSEIGRRSLLDAEAIINILSKDIARFDHSPIKVKRFD